jgi:hypothetical protein
VTELPGNGTALWRLTQLEKKVEELERKVDRLTMSIVGGAIMVAVSVTVFAITFLASGPSP